MTSGTDITLLLVCARTLSNLSNMKTRESTANESSRKVLSLIRSFESRESDSLKKRMFSEIVSLITAGKKALEKDDSRSFLLAKSLFKKAATRCRVIADLR